MSCPLQIEWLSVMTCAGETMVECAVREVLEETGIRVRCQLQGAAPVSPQVARPVISKG